MIVQGVSAGRPGSVQGGATPVVTPIASGPTPKDQPRPQSAQPRVATATLMSDAMTVLIEAQERLGQAAPSLVRQYTAQKIGQLIWRLDDAPVLSAAPFDARQLKVAEADLVPNIIDVRV